MTQQNTIILSWDSLKSMDLLLGILVDNPNPVCPTHYSMYSNILSGFVNDEDDL